MAIGSPTGDLLKRTYLEGLTTVRLKEVIASAKENASATQGYQKALWQGVAEMGQEVRVERRKSRRAARLAPDDVDTE